MKSAECRSGFFARWSVRSTDGYCTADMSTRYCPICTGAGFIRTIEELRAQVAMAADETVQRAMAAVCSQSRSTGYAISAKAAASTFLIRHRVKSVTLNDPLSPE